MEVSVRTVLLVKGGAVVKCQGGMRFPAELQDALTINMVKNRAVGISIRQLPMLMMDKIVIEHGKVDSGSKEHAEAVPASQAVVLRSMQWCSLGKTCLRQKDAIGIRSSCREILGIECKQRNEESMNLIWDWDWDHLVCSIGCVEHN